MKLKTPHYILLVFVLVTAFAIYFSYTSPLSRAIRRGERINAVVLGTDLVDYARHSDTMMFVSYDPRTRFLDIISIPRDTQFSPKGYNFRKINEIYAYSWRKSKDDAYSCRQVQTGIEELFSGKVTVPYYLQIDYASFRAFINMIGGVTIDVEEPMHYDDTAGKLHIHFNPGVQKLDGQQALEYVRFRSKAGDLGRVLRQQYFFKAILDRLKNPMVLATIPKIVYTVAKDIKTNLKTWDILVCLLEARHFSQKNLRLAQLPGASAGNYWKIDQENTQGLLEKIFPENGDGIVSQGPQIKVEVWNASGRPRVAEKVAWLLRKQGFDVMDYGNFATRQKKTLIKDLTGNLRAAQKISECLDCGEVVTRYDAKRLIDVSVILGEDCQAVATE
jgi:LCP family protein required for cell wall assembly